MLEAENGTVMAGTSHDWQTQTAQAGHEGNGYRRALPDVGARFEETETASSPSLSWPIYNETADTYSVWVRGMAQDAGGDSLHVGLDGGTPGSAADLTGFTDEWSWSKVTMSGGSATVDLTTTGEHTLEAYMREDGLRVDRMLLVTDTNYIPTGPGPVESPFQTITETVPGGLGTTSIAYSYDALYQLTDAAYTGAITATFEYVYDSVGNMTAFTETVNAQTTGVTRSFDAANRLQTSTDAAGTTSYIYDDNGNLSTVYPPGSDAQNPVGALQYAYDQRNLMLSHETNPDGTAWLLQAEYVYDGANDRLQQVDHTGATPITTTYANDIFGLTQVLMADDGTAQVYNLFGLDLISQDSGFEVRTLLVDGLGSVRLEMVGGVVETVTTYSPYGEVLEQMGTSGTEYGFTGEQEDSATGLLYLRARYYSVYIYRMLTPDSIVPSFKNPQSLNRYSYVLNNPVRFQDPTGHCPSPPAGSGNIICVDLFIAAETVGGVGEGDNRTYDYDSDPDQSRAYAYLHLDDEGAITLVEAFVNDSVVLGRSFGPYNENNVFEVFQSPATNEIIVNWSLENGFSGYLGNIADDLADDETPWGDVGSLCLDFAASTLPDINGYLAIAQVNGRYEVTEMNRDPFPSLEIYHYTDGEFTQTILRRPEEDFFGTFSAFYGLNPIARNDVIIPD